MTLTHRLIAPGWYRAVLGVVLGFAFGLGLVVLVRSLYGYEPLWDWNAIVTVGGLIAAPLGFLVGIGCFDYWFRWASGAPTVPEDHSGHGAYSWKDYFRVNTDHKVIGIQYICTTMFFFVAGGLMAMLIRAELAQPGTQFVDPNTYNGLFSVRLADDLPVHHPGLRRDRELRDPADDRGAGHGVPAPERPLVLDAAGGGHNDDLLVLRRGRRLRYRLDRLRPLSTESPMGQQFFTLGVQFAGASSIATALNFLVTIITMRAPGMTFWRMPLLVWRTSPPRCWWSSPRPSSPARSSSCCSTARSGRSSSTRPPTGTCSCTSTSSGSSHPAVYIMMLPGFGIISEVISTHSRKPVFGYRMMAFSLVAIVILGFTVWAHHMFVSGMQSWLRIPMMITTMLIAVPTGIKIFSWLATLWRA